MHSGKGLISVFWGVYAGIGGACILAGGLSAVLAFYVWGLNTFLIFTNFLKSLVFIHSATREATRKYHVYK